MPELLLHARKLESIFELLGTKENNITYSLGWAFSRSPGFLQQFLNAALNTSKKWDLSSFEILLQEHKHEGGFTDIEFSGPDVHIIIEAKRGWNLPQLGQLKRYLPRFKPKLVHRVFITMSECTEVFAKQHLPAKVGGISVHHMNWQDLFHLSQNIRGSHAEKRLMEELRNYIHRIVNMQNQETNWVYVLALSNHEWAPGLTFIQVVEERKKYFHPMGTHGWPKEPPNYIAFRYRGRLQSIHHIEKALVINNFHPHFPEYPNRIEKTQHFLYWLGAAIRPAHEVKTGKVYANGRKWAMLDLLLTTKTIAQACERSKKRVESQ